MMYSRFKITNATKATLPRVAFRAIKDTVLGKDYALNLIMTTPSKIKKMNTIYRGKEKPTDILSFPIEENEGEIYMCPSEVKKERKKFDRSYENFLIFLFIHGCVHLKGYDHGSTMESVEKKIRKQFRI
jgi:probable rRNA maturation factor